MATLKKIDTTGLTLYVVLRDAALQLWNTATVAMEAFNAANYTSYDIAATEQGSTGFYSAISPATLPVGVYSVDWRSQQAGTPAQSDPCIGLLSAYWDGVNWFADWAVKLAQSAAPVTNSPESNVKDALADTNELQADWHDAGRLDLILDARAAANTALSNATWTDAKAGYLTGAVALEATLTAIKGAGWTTETLAAIDALIDAIKAKTDGLNFTGTDVKATLDGEEVTPTAASKTGYALSSAGALAILNSLTSGLTTVGGLGKWLLDTMLLRTTWTDARAAKLDNLDGASLGTGARTVTITVTDGTDPLENATVRMTSGAESYAGSTSALGVVTFLLDDATWVVAVTKALYSFTSTTLVVNGNETQTYAMTAVTIPASDPDLVTGYWYCYDENGDPESGVIIQLKMKTFSGYGASFDTKIREETSGANGLVTFTNLTPGATYQARRGTEYDWTEVTVSSTATDPYAMLDVLGED